MYLEYVIFKGMDTIIEEVWLCIDLRWNVYTLPFYPKTVVHIKMDITQNIKEHNKPDTNKIFEDINKSIEWNETLTEYRNNTKYSRD